MEILGGTKEREITEKEKDETTDRDRKEENEAGEEEITKEELVEQLRKLEKGKAPGENGIENKAWRLMPREIGEVLQKLINRIWKEGKQPEEWNRGTISPIFKKSEKGDIFYKEL